LNIIVSAPNDFDLHNISTHAEDNVIKELLWLIGNGRMKERHARRLHMYIFCIGMEGQMKLSRPCEDCVVILSRYDHIFSRIYYSIDNDTLGRWK